MNCKFGECVGERLSGYIDGELTQQERQFVEVRCQSCVECRDTLNELRALRQKIGKAKLSDVGEDVWRETMDDTAVNATRGLGWMFLIGGVLLAIGFALFQFITGEHSLSIIEVFVVGGVYGGLLLLFISVLRQRLIERKTDKYKDVEI
ncbi:MAG: hypothetical protein AAF438_10275 [Pseudomonadota bacterium]